MKYIKPEIKISIFQTEDIITTSSNGDVYSVFKEAANKDYSYAQAVNVTEILGKE